MINSLYDIIPLNMKKKLHEISSLKKNLLKLETNWLILKQIFRVSAYTYICTHTIQTILWKLVLIQVRRNSVTKNSNYRTLY